MKKKWWKEAVVYQVYPRSFYDSNNDGIGDLNGVIAKLDYLKTLGIDVIWLNPCYKSPNDDNGYDISNYREIMDEFGSMDDFNNLLYEAHKRNIKIIMDLVVNHCSDEHKWFTESRKSKDNKYRDYFIWKQPKNGREPNNWGSYFSPSAWEYDDITGEYYLHLFSKKQPDLNWENPKLREEIYNSMNFWLDKGIDGFRMDVVNLYKKPAGLMDSDLPANCADGFSFDPKLYANNAGLLEILQEMNKQTFSKYNTMTVGEAVEVTPKIALPYVDENNKCLNMIFHFEIVGMKENFTWSKYKRVQRNWIKGLGSTGWNSNYMGNHDNPRSVSVYGNDKKYRVESAKMLATIIHTLPGTPYIYQGEEIGMTNAPFPSIQAFNDINAKFTYTELLKSGKTSKEALDYLNIYSRDHSRTPMQWDSSENAGFTKATPWLMINPNYTHINVSEAICDQNSIYYYYKNLISLRKNNSVLVYGDFHEYLCEREDVYMYMRTFNDVKWLVIVNLTDKQIDVEIPIKSEKSFEYLLSNYGHSGKCSSSVLKPYQADILLVI
ncbi:MAG: alpha-glucosidase [Clostridium sp.]|uniref:alpha-glucosidase n=1 Tax=Clostridium sp. TaxID=1506 RepID=UPI003D6D7BD3